jgi:hypothetical protein
MKINDDKRHFYMTLWEKMANFNQNEYCKSKREAMLLIDKGDVNLHYLKNYILVICAEPICFMDSLHKEIQNLH